MSYNKQERRRATPAAKPTPAKPKPTPRPVPTPAPGPDQDPDAPDFVELRSVKPLDLELGCVCCGKDTTHRVRIDTTPNEGLVVESATAAAGCLVPFGFVIDLARAGARPPKIKIPYCRACRIRYIFPAARTLIPILLFFGTLAFMAVCAVRENWIGLAVWGILMFVALAIVLLAETAINLRRNPVEVEKHGTVYRYRFHPGGAYYAWAARKAKTPPPLPGTPHRDAAGAARGRRG